MQSMKVDTHPSPAYWVHLKIIVRHTSLGSSFVHYQCCLWFPGIIFGSYSYLKVAVSDRVAIEK